MLRYRAESAKIFCGVCMSRIRGLLNRNPNADKTTAIPTVDIRDVLTQHFIFPYSLAPKYREITTEHPMFSPVATAMKIMVIGYDAPTAASASTPTNFPATILSTIL